MFDVICLGEALIDLVSTVPVASVAEAPAFVPAAGGSPTNAAVGLARLGNRTGFIGKVGDDPFGRYLERVLRLNSVDTTHLSFDSRARTALAFVALDEEGHPDFVFYRHPSADMLLNSEDVAPDYLAKAKALHTGSIILAAEPARSAAIEAIRLSRAAGSLVCIDPNVRLSVWEDLAELRRVLLPVLSQADVVKLSEEDLAMLVGVGEADSGSAELLRLGPQLVVVTAGERGCFCRNARGTLAVPGYRVPVVETTGAGDAFVAGLITGLLALGVPRSDLATLGQDALRPVLRLANAVGALTCTERGAIPALPTLSNLRRFLSELEEWAALKLVGGSEV